MVTLDICLHFIGCFDILFSEVIVQRICFLKGRYLDLSFLYGYVVFYVFWGYELFCEYMYYFIYHCGLPIYPFNKHARSSQ